MIQAVHSTENTRKKILTYSRQYWSYLEWKGRLTIRVVTLPLTGNEREREREEESASNMS